MRERVIKVMKVVNKEMLILKRERMSKNRNVIMVMKSVLNDLRDEVRMFRERRRLRGERFANALNIGRNNFVRVKERLNERSLRRLILKDESELSHRRDMFGRERPRFFEMLNKEIGEV